MRNRVPTKVLGNGAIRYAIYDEQGSFLRYEYILPADEPTDAGTPLDKANMLSDTTAALLPGLPGDPTVNDAFANLGVKAQNLQSGINQLSATKGNCEIYTGQYVGNGQRNLSLTFPKRPAFLIVLSTETWIRYVNRYVSGIVVEGMEFLDFLGENAAVISVSGATITLAATQHSDVNPINMQNVTFHYLALAAV